MSNGFNSPTTDEPLAGNPRVHEEGRHNYERNNKSSDWFAHSNEVTDVRPESRLRSDAARANALKNRGTVQEDLKQAGAEKEHPQDVTPDVHENGETVKRGEVNSHVDNHVDVDVTPKSVPKVKSPVVEDHKEREPDSPSVSVNHSSASTTPDLGQPPPPPPRLELDLRDIADKHKGEPLVKSNGKKTSKDSKLGRLHQESSGSGWDQSPPHHRLRADGEGIARKNKTDSITEIFEQNNSSPEVKEPKTPKSVSDTYTPRKPPTPRIRPDGLHNLQKAMNHSEMSAIMHGSPVDPALPRPTTGRKILPHMQRSELW